MTCTETQSEKQTNNRNEKYTHKNKPNHNVTVNCNNLYLKSVILNLVKITYNT